MSRREILASAVVAILLFGCAAQAPAPVVEAKPVPVVAGADPGVLLSGRIVTMNDAGEVLTGARLWIRGGHIDAILKAGDSLPVGAERAPAVDTGGVIYPGLIDLHNHPEYAIYPLMPVTRKYKDRYEWRYYDDDYPKRISNPNIVMANAEYYNLGMEIGRYGEYMALAGGTTSLQGGGTSFSQGASSVLQGGRYFRPYAKEECLVRNIETSPVAARPAFSYVDIGRDVTEWKRLRDDFERGTLIVHLAEGASSRMADEFRFLKSAGLLGPNLVVIHGAAMTDGQFREMAAAKASLVWSPLSNFLLYGRTANIEAARAAGVSISIAPDWAPSGSKSVLGELKVADLVNKHQLNTLFTDRDLVEMVTRKPAGALGWNEKLGQIRQGYLADLVVVDDRNSNPYRNLIAATEEQIRLVMVRGEALYGDSALLQKIRADKNDMEVTTTFGGKRSKSITPDCPGTALPAMSVKDTMKRLQEGLQFDPAYTAKVVSPAQLARDLEKCGLAKPAEPAGPPDAARVLNCRFGLPFEKTLLNPLTTAEDPQYMARLLANPNIPAYLKALPGYYGK